MATDYAASADLYTGFSRSRARRIRYLRFPTTAEAIRFAIEHIPHAELAGVVLETGDERHEGEAIRALYAAVAYPLERQLA